MGKGWLIVSKKEMTKMWIGDRFVPVTLVKVNPQEIIRYKNNEKDWYIAVVVWSDKSEVKKEKWQKVDYKMITEFKVDEDFVVNNEVWKALSIDFLTWVDEVSITWYGKGKGFQWAMKKDNVHGWPKTHWSKFHRTVWSMWNRKPRRTFKWHPHAWHLWNEKVTLKNKKILDVIKGESENLLAIKWSIPGWYNSLLILSV